MKFNFCGNCDHFYGSECRRFPPAPVPIVVDNQTGRTEVTFVYPSLFRDTPCCGEFKDEAQA